ncbi:MAG TPA: hypothetical protein VGG28_02615 [Kofleriaceae bacterium]
MGSTPTASTIFRNKLDDLAAGSKPVARRIATSELELCNLGARAIPLKAAVVAVERIALRLRVRDAISDDRLVGAIVERERDERRLAVVKLAIAPAIGDEL